MELILKERAEDYTESEILQFIKLWEDEEEKRRDYALESYNMNQFINSPTDSCINVYGAKGMGKTFFVRATLLALGIREYVYLSYYKDRTVPMFVPGKIVVVDDIHYFMDDIREGKQTVRALVELLMEALVFAQEKKGKVIFISEDGFPPNYIDDAIYKEICPMLSKNQIFIRTFGNTITKSLHIEDRNLQKFFNETRPTTRGAISLLSNVGRRWTTICKKAFELLTEEEKKMVFGAFKPKPKKRQKVKVPEPKEPIDAFWKKMYDYYIRMMSKELGPGRISDFVKDFNARTEAEKQGILNDYWGRNLANDYYHESKMYEDDDEFDEAKAYHKFQKDIKSGEFTSPYFRKLVAVVFAKYLYKDQSYYDHLMKLAGLKPTKKKGGKRLPSPEDYLANYIEGEI